MNNKDANNPDPKELSALVNDLSIRDRIKELMYKLDFDSKTEFANKLGMSDQTFRSFLTRDNRVPNFEFFVRISHVFPQVNLDWLILGKGSMFRPKKGDGTYAVIEESFNPDIQESEPIYQVKYESEKEKNEMLLKQVDVLQKAVESLSNLQK